MNKKFIIPIILFLYAYLPAQEHLQIVQGLVLDNKTKAPISDVMVTSGKTYCFTNEKGEFKLSVDSSSQVIRFKLVGYEIKEIPTEKLSDAPVFLEESFLLLSTTVVSASKYERPIAESTVSMSVITKEMPDRLNSISGEKVLDRIPGVQIIDGQANIRGGSGYSYGAGSRVLLMMDDLPMMQHDAANPYWNDLPIENIGQIEVIKGASSTLYGSSAMNGVIHFRSKLPESEPYTSISIVPTIYLKPGNGKEWWGKEGVISLPYENYFSVAHRYKINKWDYSINASYDRKIGFNKENNSDNVRINGITRYRMSDSLLITLGINANGGSSSDFFYWLDNGLYEGAQGAVTRSDKLRFTIDPGLSYHDRKGFHHKFLSRYYNIFNGADNNQENKSHHAYGEYQMRKRINSLMLDVQAGLVLNGTWTKAKLYSDTVFTLKNQALYFQLEKRFWSRLIVNGGIRYERYSSDGPGKLAGKDIAMKTVDDRVILRAGMNYQLLQASFLRVSIGEGFRFPSLAEKYISTFAGGLQIVPNPNLQSEHGWNAEIGVRQGLSIFGFKGMIDFSYFESSYYDMMEFVLNNQLQFQSKNIGNTQINGCEAELYFSRSIRNSSLTIQAGYTYINPKYREFDLAGKQLAINEREFAPIGQQNAANSSSNENVLKYRSKDLFRFDINLEFKKFYAGYSFQYVSHVQAIDWLFQVTLFIKGIDDFRKAHDQGYRIHDIRIGTHLQQWNIQLNVNNLLNEIYTTRPGLLEAPRNISLKLRYTF